MGAEGNNPSGEKFLTLAFSERILQNALVDYVSM